MGTSKEEYAGTDARFLIGAGWMTCGNAVEPASLAAVFTKLMESGMRADLRRVVCAVVLGSGHDGMCAASQDRSSRPSPGSPAAPDRDAATVVNCVRSRFAGGIVRAAAAASVGLPDGYFDGYVVVYDPVTYFIATMVDLLGR